MIASTKNGSVMYSMLDSLSPEKEIIDHDWCQLVLDAKEDWVRCDPKEYFRGPLTYLVLLYLDSTSCPGFEVVRDQPPISFWIHDFMNMRKDQEFRNGGFGLGDIREMYNDEVDYDADSEEEAVDLSKNDVREGTSFVEGTTLEGCVASILAMFEDVECGKGKLECAIKQLMTHNPKSESVIPILERYKKIFNKSVLGENCEPEGFSSPTFRKTGTNVEKCNAKSNGNMNVDRDLVMTPHIGQFLRKFS